MFLYAQVVVRPGQHVVGRLVWRSAARVGRLVFEGLLALILTFLLANRSVICWGAESALIRVKHGPTGLYCHALVKSLSSHAEVLNFQMLDPVSLDASVLS